MITIRGKTVVVKPLTVAQIGEALDSVKKLGECTPTNKVLLPEYMPHLLRVVAISIRHEFPGATVEELAEDVREAIDMDNLTAVLLALSDSQNNIPAAIEVHKENTHVRKC